MKIVVIGGSGTIGKNVAATFSKRNHEVITAGRNSGDIKVDITAAGSIEKMFNEVKDIDAVICTAGTGYYGDLQTMKEENVLSGIRSKLLSQVNVVLIGQQYIKDNGSFSLISGVLADDPVKNAAVMSIINAGINSFVLAASQELKRGIRINAICPGLLEESVDKYGANFPGFNPVSIQRVVNAFIKSVEGITNGKVIKIY